MVISVEDWALIRRLVAEGVPQRQVARDLGIGRSTVTRALASHGPPKYERQQVPTQTGNPTRPIESGAFDNISRARAPVAGGVRMRGRCWPNQSTRDHAHHHQTEPQLPHDFTLPCTL